MLVVVLLCAVVTLGLSSSSTTLATIDSLDGFKLAVLNNQVPEVSSYLVSLEPSASASISSRIAHTLHSLPRLVASKVGFGSTRVEETLAVIPKLSTKVAALGLIDMTVLLTDFYAKHDTDTAPRSISVEEVISGAALQAVVHNRVKLFTRISELLYFPISMPRVTALLDTAVAYDRMEVVKMLLEKGFTSQAMFFNMRELPADLRPDILKAVLDHAGVKNLPHLYEFMQSIVNEGNIEAVQVLLNYPSLSGHNIEAMQEKAFQAAVLTEQFPILEYLTRHRMVKSSRKDFIFGVIMGYSRTTPALVKYLLETEPLISMEAKRKVATEEPILSPGFSVLLENTPALMRPNSLIYAAASGSLPLVSRLLQDSTDEIRIKSLLMAAVSGQSEVMELLLQDTPVSHEALLPIFSLAVYSGSTATASLLLSDEITASEVGQVLSSAMYSTLEPEMLRFLLNSRNIPPVELHTILKEALTYRMKDAVFEVLSKFPGFMTTPEFSTMYVGEVDEHGVENTLLHAIACAGYIDSVSLIVNSEADTTTLNSEEETFMEYAGSYHCGRKEGLALYENLNSLQSKANVVNRIRIPDDVANEVMSYTTGESVLSRQAITSAGRYNSRFHARNQATKHA